MISPVDSVLPNSTRAIAKETQVTIKAQSQLSRASRSRTQTGAANNGITTCKAGRCGSKVAAKGSDRKKR